MNTLNLAENIVKLRKSKGITQEELASFIGVTKASVSKWENSQSMPDILLLPQIASYFDVTVDSLLGYEPQLSKEQIQGIYRTLAKAFSDEPFEQVYSRCDSYIKKYYSCYSFLSQMCVLLMNHFMMAESATRQQEILVRMEDICNHIIKNCKNAGICSDATVMRADINLQMGNPDRTIEEVEELINPYRLLNQSDGLLIQAYAMKGDIEKADQFTQLSMYLHLLEIMGDGVQYLNLHMQDKDICIKTIERIDKLIEIYNLDELVENAVAVYQYQVAIFMSSYGNMAEALKRLRTYADIVIDILENKPMLHGDSYFNKLDKCFEDLELGSQLVRDRKVIINSGIEQLDNPMFDQLKETEEFQKIFILFKNAKNRIQEVEDASDKKSYENI